MEKNLTTENTAVFYTDDGTGFPIIFLHGFCEDHTIWKDFIPPFLKQNRVIVPDLAGFGKSTLNKGEVSIDQMAESIKAIIDKEQLEKVVIIGHSMGGYVTLAFAEKYANLLAGFGLFHSICFADDEAKKESRRKVADFVKSNGSAPFVKELYGKLFSSEFAQDNRPLIDELVNYASGFSADGIGNASLAMSKRPDRSQVLKETKNPVLFIVGRHDQTFPFEKSMQMVHLPQAASIHVLDHSAHMGMIEEKEISQQIVKDWLEVTIPNF